jgi:hypothetical protein
MTLLDKIKLGQNEKALHVVRHWGGLLVPHFVFVFLIAVFDFFLMAYLFSQGIIGVLAFLAILAVIGVYSWRLAFLWRRNIMVITNKRLIDWEQTGFFEQLIQEIPFSDIEGVEAGHKGLLGKIFKFGNLTLKMKEEKHPFVLYKVKFPVRAAEIVKRLLSGVAPEEAPRVMVEVAKPEIEIRNVDDFAAADGAESLLAAASVLPLEEKKKFYADFKKMLIRELKESLEAQEEN